ncbi:MAG: SIS domain-containing protein [Vicinamibacterales bacterium]
MVAEDPVAGAALVVERCDAAARLHEQAGRANAPSVVEAATRLFEALTRGGKVLVFGNGGSAAEAQHFAAELVGRFMLERQALPAIALTTDTSILTAIGNDYAFDRVFARQVEALGRRGDIAVGLSTSGRSPNVIAAFEAARSAGLTTIALTGGTGGALAGLADIHLNVPDASVARVQEVHLTLLHTLCELVERKLQLT